MTREEAASWLRAMRRAMRKTTQREMAAGGVASKDRMAMVEALGMAIDEMSRPRMVSMADTVVAMMGDEDSDSGVVKGSGE